MDNNRLVKESWWLRNWKWFTPLVGCAVFALVVFFSIEMHSAVGNLTKAYTDTELYDGALEIVRSSDNVIALAGEIEPIDKLAILEGSVGYSDDNKKVNSSVRVKGSKLIARMDIAATKNNGIWSYTEIKIRVKNPPEKRQVVLVIGEE